MKYRYFMAQAEKNYWINLLKIHPSITRAAQAAGVNRSTVHERLKALGIESSRQNRGNEAWQALADDPKATDFFKRRLGGYLTSERKRVTGRI